VQTTISSSKTARGTSEAELIGAQDDKKSRRTAMFCKTEVF
jgi:hypothetical protein